MPVTQLSSSSLSSSSYSGHSLKIDSLPLNKHAPVKAIAKRTLFQQRASAPKVPLNAKLLPSSGKGHQVSRITSCWKFFKSTYIAKLVVVGGLKTMQMGLTWTSTPKRARNNNERELSELSGPELTKMLQECAEPLAKIVQDLLVSGRDDDGIKTFINRELSTIHSLLKVMLPLMCVNLVKHVQESIYEETGEYPKTVSVLDVICCLQDLIQNHLPHIFERIEQIEAKPDSPKREKKILQLFIPLTDELMAIFFPQGQTNLPIARIVPFLSTTIWSQLRNHIIPSVLMTGYQKLTEPFNLDDKQKLLTFPNGDTLVTLAETAGMQSGELIPSLLTEGSTVLDSIKEGVSQLCKGSPELKRWLSRWMVKQVETIANSGRKEIGSIFNLCGKYIEPILLHVFRHMASVPISPDEAQGALPDAIGMLSIKFMAIVSNFMNTHEKAISNRIEVLEKASESIEEDPKILELFGILATDLLHVAGLDDHSTLPVPDFLREVIGSTMQVAAPKFLIQQYLAIKRGNIQDVAIRKKLRSFFFDEKKLKDPKIGTNVISFLHSQGKDSIQTMFDDFYQQLWEESGTNRIVQIIESMCAVFAGDLVDTALSKLGISAQKALKIDNSPFMAQTVEYLKTLTETIVLRILTNTLATTPENIPPPSEEHPRKFLAINVLIRLIDSFHRGLKHIDDKLKEIDKFFGDNPVQHALEIRKAFSILAEDLHAMSGHNPLSNLPLDGLPAPNAIKEMLWQTIKNVVLPDVLALQYHDIAAWDTQFQTSLDELEKCYHTSHPQWACKVLAQYGTDFIRYYLATSGNESAKLIIEAMKSYFAASAAPMGKTSQALLEAQALEIGLLLGSNLSLTGDYHEAPMTEFWPLLTRYIEGAIAKFLAGFSLTIRDIEAKNPDFMVDIAISMLKDTADYFSIVNTIVEQYDEKHAYNIDPMAIITGFREHLHPGVPVNPASPESEKDRIRLEGCFIPRAMNLLELANISINDFPLPAAFRQPLGELFVGTILPLALLRADQNALGHNIRDALMLNFVQTLYTALNGIEPMNKEEVLEESKPSADPKQKRLNETCGSVVLELVKLIPDTMVQYVFMKEKVQNMSAEAIGEAIMPFLSRWTLLQLIDTLIFIGLPNFHPSKWEGKVGREVLIPRKTFIKPNGKTGLRLGKKFKFLFPRSAMEIQEDRLTQMQNAQKTRLMLRDGFTIIISNQLRMNLWEGVKALWADFQRQLDALIERQFPEKGLQVKNTLDRLFRKFWFNFIGTIVQFISIPLVNGAELLVRKWYIDTKSNDIIENLHSDALENLVYKWMDTLLDTLLKLRAQDQAKKKG